MYGSLESQRHATPLKGQKKWDRAVWRSSAMANQRNGQTARWAFSALGRTARWAVQRAGPYSALGLQRAGPSARWTTRNAEECLMSVC